LSAGVDWSNLPLFPLGTVLFPGGVLPLRVFETRYVDMMRECMKSGQPFGVCLIKEGNEVGTPAIPHDVGCLASIVDFDMQQPGVLNITTRGAGRFRVLDTRTDPNGLVRANAAAVADDPATSVPAEFNACSLMLGAILPKLPAGMIPEPHRFDDASWLSNRLAEILPIQALAKQRLMELPDPLMRIEIIYKFLGQQGLKTG
jgi:hypothetical protein